jgi:hypothetical protein
VPVRYLLEDKTGVTPFRIHPAKAIG